MNERRHPPARREDDREELERLRTLELLNQRTEEERRKSDDSYAVKLVQTAFFAFIGLVLTTIFTYVIAHYIFHVQ